MDDFTRRIAREQFALGRMQVGAVALPEIFPLIEGQMVPIEEIPKLVQEGKLESATAEELERKYDQFRQEFTVVYRKTLSLSRELASEMSYHWNKKLLRCWWTESSKSSKKNIRALRFQNTSKKCAITFWTIWSPSKSERARRISNRHRKAAEIPWWSVWNAILSGCTE